MLIYLKTWPRFSLSLVFSVADQSISGDVKRLSCTLQLPALMSEENGHRMSRYLQIFASRSPSPLLHHTDASSSTSSSFPPYFCHIPPPHSLLPLSYSLFLSTFVFPRGHTLSHVVLTADFCQLGHCPWLLNTLQPP